MIDATLSEVKEPQVKVLLDATELEGWELRAAWDDFKLGLKHGMNLYFSLSKILDTKIGAGPIKDIGILTGLNMDLDAEVVKYLPGIRLSWEIEGFALFNTDFAYYGS